MNVKQGVWVVLRRVCLALAVLGLQHQQPGIHFINVINIL